MWLGVISDTHGQVEATRDALRIFDSIEVETIVHCGDIGGAAIVSLFSQRPTHFVLGNVDYAEEIECAIRDAGQHCHGRFGKLELEGLQVGFLHGDDQQRLTRESRSGRWDVLCHGHTHHAMQTMVGKTLVVNPGAFQRVLRPSVALVELPARRVQLLTI
jgi:hypothetical protein